MYIDECKSGKYYRALLRVNYYENGTTKHRTLLNLSNHPVEEIQALKFALKHKKNLESLILTSADVTLHDGLNIGPYHLLRELSKRIGLNEILGDTTEGRMALWQIMNHMVNQGSRLSAVRQAGEIAVGSLFSLESFNEDNLYANLDWLKQKQSSIEDALFQRLYPDGNGDLFFYDVTSSYLEGDKNELSEFGYNRDRKRGKKQIVIGLLCDVNGLPLSITVFHGNTSDTKTFAKQVQTVSERFGGGSVTFVGDRGMIKSPQIQSLSEKGFHFITALTRAQIETLLKQDIIQQRLFDEHVTEVIDREAGLRYVIRRNPCRADQIAKTRNQKIACIQTLVAKENQRLQDKQQAHPEKSLVRLNAKARQLKVASFLQINLAERTLVVALDEQAIASVAELDGCYVLKTDVLDRITKEVIHQRYKDLVKVEKAFRVSKTEHLEMRPIYVRLEDRTRAHALVVMLAYRLRLELARSWQSLDLTVQEGLDHLRSLKVIDIKYNGQLSFSRIPEMNDTSKQLYTLAEVAPPIVLPPNTSSRPATKRKLTERRKQR